MTQNTDVSDLNVFIFECPDRGDTLFLVSDKLENGIERIIKAIEGEGKTCTLGPISERGGAATFKICEQTTKPSPSEEFMWYATNYGKISAEKVYG